ncbi:DUF551 domain-containing protein [Acinetobacter seifertii]|nr:DUF551 domain-containing protein [Acinetobacter seifertii]
MEWICCKQKMPKEDTSVLFRLQNGVIHDGFLTTDYSDGPYGENGEDFGDYSTMWSSLSSGIEYDLHEVTHWMPLPEPPKN